MGCKARAKPAPSRTFDGTVREDWNEKRRRPLLLATLTALFKAVDAFEVGCIPRLKRQLSNRCATT